MTKQLKKIQVTNMMLWLVAILMPILGRAFSSKDPKIFEFLFPLFQMMLAIASTRMFSELSKSTSEPSQNNLDNR